jgi:hypothetical protein
MRCRSTCRKPRCPHERVAHKDVEQVMRIMAKRPDVRGGVLLAVCDLM